MLMFGDNEMLLVQGTDEIVKSLVPHKIYWCRIGGQAAILNTGCSFSL